MKSFLEKESPSCWDAKLIDIIFEASNGGFDFYLQHNTNNHPDYYHGFKNAYKWC
jgi:hypothetical protein